MNPIKRSIFPCIFLFLLILLNIGSAQVLSTNTPRSPFKSITQNIIQTNDLLSPNDAFKPSIIYERDNPQVIKIYWEINPEYYLYKNKISFNILNQNLELLETTFGSGKAHTDEFFGTQEIYDAPILMSLRFSEAIKEIHTLYLTVEAQGCAKSGFCFAPYEWRLNTVINPNAPLQDLLKNASSNEDTPLSVHDKITSESIDHPYFALLSFFGLGLLLSFTPCVLPMLPILSGIITSQRALTPRKGFMISLIYVLAMALVYTAFGLLAAFFGKSLAVYLQHPYVLMAFSLIFVLLALSMFGLYQIQMPAFIQTKLSTLSNQQQSKNNYVSIAIMGALSALIAGPCVTAPLIGAIGFVATTQNYLLGAMIFFSLAVGMGTPLLILGASSGHLLPKAGAWMEQIKILFGFMLLMLAAYFLGRTLDHFWEQISYAIIAFATFIWLITYMAEHRAGRLFFSLIALAALTVGVNAMIESKRPIESYFTEIKGIAGLNQAIKNNPSSITMLEFYADWCASCKELEKYVFSYPEVKEELSSFNLLRTDVTANESEDKALQKHFNLYGPPVMLFFDAKGKELTEYRLIGYLNKDSFLKHIRYLKTQQNP